MEFSKCVMVFAVVAISSLVKASPQYQACGGTCRFAFCGDRGYGDPNILIGKHNDSPISPPICDKYGKVVVGSVDSTGEAYVLDEYHKKPISHYSPYGLKQNFSPSFFKSYYFGHKHRSGVGHETPQQNQLDFLDNKCIVLPLTAYQVLDKYGNVYDEIHPQSTPFKDCVAFTTSVHKHYY